MTSMEDDLNGRQPLWKTTSMEDNLNGRQPHWKTTSMEDNLNEEKLNKDDLNALDNVIKLNNN